MSERMPGEDERAQSMREAIEQEQRQFDELDERLYDVAEAIRPLLHIGGDVPGDYAEFRLTEILDAVYPQRAAARAFRGPEKKRKAMPADVSRRVMERDAYRCVTCGTHKDLTIDHILAVANGGTDVDENLQTMCRPCNSRKGAR